jgi:hypothetical protein
MSKCLFKWNAVVMIVQSPCTYTSSHFGPAQLLKVRIGESRTCGESLGHFLQETSLV